MKLFKSLAIGVGVVLACAAIPAGLAVADGLNPQLTDQKGRVTPLALNAAALTDCRRQSAANEFGQDIFLTTSSPKTYTGTDWQNVDCASTTFRLKYNERALIVSDFNAEADCSGASPTNGQWCETRALLNGIVGTPTAGEPSSFAFDSVAGGTSDWKAPSMQRGWEVRCTNVNGCQYKHIVQTKMHDASVSGFWLDDLATHIRVTIGNPAAL